jgi:hypothetical protein
VLDFSRLPDVSDIHDELPEPDELIYAAHMKAREDALEHIFGKSYPNGDILSPIDPNLMLNWSGGGIYQYPPDEKRSAWHYVTSGLSQPFPDDDWTATQEERCSGFGIELVISTPEQANWPLNLLLNIVGYLLFQENAHVILPGDRLPCNGPLVLNTNTKLNFLVAKYSTEYATEIMLPGGRCNLVHLVGVTESEIQYALSLGKGTTAGSIVLCHVLDKMGVGCVSDPNRECLTTHRDFEETWDRTRTECQLQWEQNAKKDA